MGQTNSTIETRQIDLKTQTSLLDSQDRTTRRPRRIKPSRWSKWSDPCRQMRQALSHSRDRPIWVDDQEGLSWAHKWDGL